MAYPADLRALTSLRFVAAFWILIYHFRNHLGLEMAETSGLIAMGKLGVDLFFILSGFILAHVYLPEVERGTYNHGRFLWLRLARIYPLHLLMLIAMVGLWAVATVAGVQFGAEAFKVSDLPAHLLLIHAWGTVASDGWNFPSWSVSAEWFAYLCFPGFAWVAIKLRERPLVMLGLACALLVAIAFQSAGPVQGGITERTSQFGILRIVPAFAIGVALYQLGRLRPLQGGLAWPLVGLSVLWIVVGAEAGIDPILIFPGLMGLVFGLAEVSRRTRDGAFGGRVMVYLGEVSYALYMTHLMVDIVWFQIVERLGISPETPLALRLAVIGGVLVACVIAAMVAHHAVEKPARVMMRRWGETWFVPRSARVAAE